MSAPARAAPVRVAGVVVWVTLRAVAIFLVWQIAAYLFIKIPPAYASLYLAALVLLFVRLYVVRGWLSDHMIALGRPRPIPANQHRWLLTLAMVLMVLPLALTFFFMALGLVTPEELPEELRRYAERPGGGAVLLLVIVGLAPLFEEFAFRGWMQRPLERRIGPGPAIGLTSIVFALMHFQAQGIPIRMIAGVVLGYTVWVTRSIWAGVALHAAWNGGVLLLSAVFVDAEPADGGWRWVLAAGVTAALCLAAFGWVAARMAAEPGAPRAVPASAAGAGQGSARGSGP